LVITKDRLRATAFKKKKCNGHNANDRNHNIHAFPSHIKTASSSSFFYLGRSNAWTCAPRLNINPSQLGFWDLCDLIQIGNTEDHVLYNIDNNSYISLGDDVFSKSYYYKHAIKFFKEEIDNRDAVETNGNSPLFSSASAVAGILLDGVNEFNLPCPNCESSNNSSRVVTTNVTRLGYCHATARQFTYTAQQRSIEYDGVPTAKQLINGGYCVAKMFKFVGYYSGVSFALLPVVTAPFGVYDCTKWFFVKQQPKLEW